MANLEFFRSAYFPLREYPQEQFALNNLVSLQALEYLGAKTRRYTDPQNGMDPTVGFDCSGLVKVVLDDIDYPVPDAVRHANEFYNKVGIPIHDEARRAGDLVFFTYNGLWPTHVGILVSPDEFIHARYTNPAVCIERLEPRPKVTNNPEQVYFRNPIGFKRLTFQTGRYHHFT